MLYTLIFFLLLLLTSAVFSGTETAITSVNEINLSAYKGKSPRRQKIASELIKDKRSVIAAILVGNNIVNTVLAVYAGAFFDEIFVDTGMLNQATAPLIASFITIVFLLIFGEVIPKHLGVTFAKGWTFTIAYPLWGIVRVLKPITRIMDVISRLLLKLIPFKGESEDAPTIQELLLMAKFSEKAGHIDSLERKLMSKSSRFNDLMACEVMIPRNDVSAVSEKISFDELLEVFRSDMYSRVPVYRDDLDEVVGVFNFKELFKIDPLHKDTFSITRVMLPPLYVPENVVIGELFERMKTSRTHMAVVVDEYGSTAGIITMEDIVERLFGMIDDEYDNENIAAVKSHENGDIEVLGTISLHDLGAAANIVFPEDVRRQVNTLNGFLTSIKGDFPKSRDRIIWHNYIFKVMSTEGHRAKKVLIKTKEPA
ncbi:MAG: HlyC/CorC family transporter [Erysipelotrichia bacterium]|nr:HlyC/CorC family transporter [Erysipelotrichia bacterium]